MTLTLAARDEARWWVWFLPRHNGAPIRPGQCRRLHRQRRQRQWRRRVRAHQARQQGSFELPTVARCRCSAWPLGYLGSVVRPTGARILLPPLRWPAWRQLHAARAVRHCSVNSSCSAAAARRRVSGLPRQPEMCFHPRGCRSQSYHRGSRMGRVRHWRLPRPRASAPCAPGLRGPVGGRVTVLPPGGLAAPRAQRSCGLPLSRGGGRPSSYGWTSARGRTLSTALPTLKRANLSHHPLLVCSAPSTTTPPLCFFGTLARAARRGQLAIPASFRHCSDDCPPPLLAGGRHAYRTFRGLVPLAPGPAPRPGGGLFICDVVRLGTPRDCMRTP